MGNKYKDTLLLGQTNFEMRAGLKTKEPIIEKEWDKEQIYQKKLKLNHKKPLFMLHDGPPYANGDLHIGHALNKSLKDFIVRWKNATGFQAPFILGWDTHGLPIETAVTKTGVDRKKLSPLQFRQLCEKYALSQVENQMQQFMRLGIFTDPETNYLTLRPEFELTELRLFAKMYEKGLIYKALKPIYWSPSSESALAESEVEYANVKSPSAFVACDLVDQTQFPANTSVIIWTTTPWTLPTNQLIAVGPQLNYSLIKAKNDDRYFIVASTLIESVAEQVGWEKVSVKTKLVGDDLIGLNYAHPLYPQKVSQIVAGHHVSDDAGTGLVHIAGGFGEDDYLIVKKHGLAPFAPIDNQGKFTWEINDPELAGKFYDDTNKMIVNRLKESGNLLKLKFVTHSYPHDWRTKKPVIYRATLQWFINLNQSKDQILKHVDQIQTNPSWAKQRLYQVLDDRVDWTISRQRLWGVPIVAFYDEQDQLVLNDKILTYALQKIAQLGTNAWFEQKADVFLPKEYQNQNLRKEKDILDVWFDSGSTALALEAQFPQFKRPYDLYLEGNDQYRGWFNASMINSVIYDNQSPYKTLISHGMTTDEKGYKMSKSLGNGIDPIAFANDLGADILRLWVASTDYTDDQKIGPEIIKQVSESYRKIRNTLRFIMANLNDFDPKTNYQTTLNEVDEYALYQLTQFKNQAMKAYDTYQFNNVYTTVLNYVTKDLSAFYLDFIKDILYIEKDDSVRRRQVQTVLFEQFWVLIDILRPILVHTVEEAYQTLNFADQKSVHLLDIRKQDFKISSGLLKKWNLLMELKNDINKALEEAKIQGVVSKSFEASVKFALKPEFKKELSKIPTDLAQIFIVSQLEETTHDKSFQELNLGWFKVEKRVGEKCQRCWAIYDTLATEDLCDRCYNVINTKKG